jgi:hypothetical protein
LKIKIPQKFLFDDYITKYVNVKLPNHGLTTRQAIAEQNQETYSSRRRDEEQNDYNFFFWRDVVQITGL